jgi:diacylglycerol kinase (ATP)
VVNVSARARTRALCIVNPSAGKRHARPEDLPAALDVLARAGFDLETKECALPDPSCGDLVRDAVAAKYEAVIVAGGDGTVQAAAWELIGTDVVLGILPFGTFMNITKGLRIPLDALEAARVIARRHVRRADVGEVSGAVFFETAGIGLDAELFGAARAVERGRWRRALRRVGRWFRQGSHRLRIVTPSGERRIRALQALVLNSPYYTWSFPVAPEADMHDGLLDVAIFPRMSRLALLRSLVRLAREGEHLVPPIMLRERELTVSSEEPLAVHADGRLVGNLPATFRCRPGAVAVYVPEAARSS